MLSVITSGALTDSGNIAVTGTTTLAAGAANSITLDNANNFGGAVSITNGNNVTLNDINAMQLGAINAAGQVDVRTQSGDLTLTGAIATVSTSANAVTLIADLAAVPSTTGSGGNIIISGGSITTGAGGRATLYTGSVAGSTGLTTLIGSGSGNFRYFSDEATTNYTTALGAGNYAIYREQPALTITANNPAAITYGDAVPALTANVTGQQNGDTLEQIFSTQATVTAGGSVSTSGNLTAGSHTLTPAGAVENLGYALSNANGSLTVNQRALTVSATGVNKTYDGTTAATVNLSDNRIAGDVFTDTYTSATFADRNFGVGKTVNVSGINIAGADAGNYTFNNTAVTAANINKLDVTLTAPSVTKVYDGTLAYTTTGADLTAIGSVLVGGDTVTAATIGYTNANAGIGNKTVTLSGATINDGNGGLNYNILAQNGNTTSTINQANLTISTANVTKTYDGTLAAPGAAAVVTSGTLYTNASNGNVLDSLSGGTFAYTNANGNVGVGNRTVTVGGVTVNDGNGGGNYNVTYANNTTSTINQRNITLTADNATKVYGNADPTLTFSVGGLGLAGTDTITSVFTGALARAAGENVVGSPYAITQNTLAANGNYNVTAFAPGQFTITPRPLTIAADNKSKLATDPLPPFTATYSGFAFTDNPGSLTGALVFTTPATATSPAGTYVIAPSGQSSINYTITYVSGTLTVSQSGNLIPTDVLSSINSGGDQLPPPNVSGSPVVPSNFAGVSSPTNPAAGRVVGDAGTPPAQGGAAGSTGGVSSLVSIINGGVNLPTGVQ